MSRFFSRKYAELEPYVPGEQPRGMKLIKLNTNENPYPPLPEVTAAAAEESRRLQLYSDTECRELRPLLADILKTDPDELVMVNGSDEILNLAFMAYCDEEHPAVFPDITYGFYPVFAEVNLVPYRTIPLLENWQVDLEALAAAKGTVFLANPNAPTGIAVPRAEVEKLLRSDPDRMVIVDEAYVDFGAESCVPLIHEYENLLVTQTFSKSRSMAGARLGFGIGNRELIRDMNTLRFSLNPYNVNQMTQAAGAACLKRDDYNMENCRKIMRTREETAARLRELGFEMTPSSTNFLFVRHPRIDGESLYRELKARGILIRHFSLERIRDYNRITVGTPEQMNSLIKAAAAILEERA